jgi:hypothetical protein
MNSLIGLGIAALVALAIIYWLITGLKRSYLQKHATHVCQSGKHFFEINRPFGWSKCPTCGTDLVKLPTKK